MLGPCAIVPYDEQAYWMERYAGSKAYHKFSRYVKHNCGFRFSVQYIDEDAQRASGQNVCKVELGDFRENIDQQPKVVETW